MPLRHLLRGSFVPTFRLPIISPFIRSYTMPDQKKESNATPVGDNAVVVGSYSYLQSPRVRRSPEEPEADISFPSLPSALCLW